MATFEVLGLRK